MNLANKILPINFRETGLQRLSSNEEKSHQLRMNATDTMFMSVAYHITNMYFFGCLRFADLFELRPGFVGDAGLTPCIPTALTLRYSGRQSHP